MATFRIVKADRTDWIMFSKPRSVVVIPNHGPHFKGWICEESGPQAAAQDGEIVLCDACFPAQKAGAEIVGLS